MFTCGMSQFVSLVVLFCFLGCSCSIDIFEAQKIWKEQTPFQEWRKQGLTNEQMIEHLVSNMTLKQKVRQLDQYQGIRFLSNGEFNKNASEEYLKDTIGQIHDLYPPDSTIINNLQALVLDLYMKGVSPPIPVIRKKNIFFNKF